MISHKRFVPSPGSQPGSQVEDPVVGAAKHAAMGRIGDNHAETDLP